MSTNADDVLEEALKPSAQERAPAAAALLASLDPGVETRDREAWIAEVERRTQAALDGLSGLGWAETRNRIEERIGRTSGIGPSLEAVRATCSRRPGHRPRP